jgi:hypothetical protein
MFVSLRQSGNLAAALHPLADELERQNQLAKVASLINLATNELE